MQTFQIARQNEDGSLTYRPYIYSSYERAFQAMRRIAYTNRPARFYIIRLTGRELNEVLTCTYCQDI